MFRHPFLLAGVAVFVALTLTACGDEDDALQRPAGPAAAATLAGVQAPGTGSPVAEGVSLDRGMAELTTVEVVEILTPSVVQILTESVASVLFNQPSLGAGVGTGVVLDDRGNILTNNHVIAGAARITVSLFNGDTFVARVIGADVPSDIAVIRISAEGLQPAKLGTSSGLRVGEEVLAIGHALGLRGGPTVSKGVVSALGRSIDISTQNTIVDLVQSDATVNPGNSGGPLVNTRAEVIGINTAIIQGSGIGFAINIDDAMLVATRILQDGYVHRGFLGIVPVNVTPGLAKQLGVTIAEGVLVSRVISGFEAMVGELGPEDVIVQMGGQYILNNGDLFRFLIDHPPGETVDVVYYRGETKMTTRLTLQELPRQ